MKCANLISIMILMFLFVNNLNAQDEEKPYTDFVLPESHLCPNSSLTFINLGDPANIYHWVIDRNDTIETYNLQTEFETANYHRIELIADSATYTNSIAKYIAIYDTPSNYVSKTFSDSVVCRGSEVKITLNNPVGTTYYGFWDQLGNLVEEKKAGYYSKLYLSGGPVVDDCYRILTAKNQCAMVVVDTFDIRIKSSPKGNLEYAMKDSFFCNQGQPLIDVYDTETQVKYSVSYKYKDRYTHTYTSDIQKGNADKLSFEMPEIDASNRFDIICVDTTTNCKLTFHTDTVVIDTVRADFKVALLNGYINESILFSDNSLCNPSLRWSFPETAQIRNSSQSALTNSFSTIGTHTVKLLNETKLGCVDSIEHTVFINDTTYFPKAGWVVTGGRNEGWVGTNHEPCFDVDVNGNVFIAGDFRAIESMSTAFNSTKGIDLDEQQKEGSFVAMYDKFGMLRWYNLIQTNYGDRADIHCVKTIDGSKMLVSSNARLFHSSNGKTIPWKTGCYVAEYDNQGLLVDTIPSHGAVYAIEQDMNQNLYLLSVLSDTCYITKRDTEKQILWTVKYPNTYTNGFVPPRMAIDKEGSLLVEGCFTKDMNVYAVNNTFTLNYSRTYTGKYGYDDIYLMKFNTDGEYQWGNIAFTATTTSNFDYGIDVTVDDDLGVYLVGRPSTNNNIILTSSDMSRDTIDAQNYFLAKYDSDGMYQWSVGAKMQPDKYRYWVRGERIITGLNNNLYVLGYVKHNCTFTSTDVSTNFLFDKEDKEHFFIANYSNDGVLKNVWLSPKSNVNAGDLALDNEGNFLMLSYNTGYQRDFEILNTTVSLKEEEYLLTKLNPKFSKDTISMVDFNTGEFCKNDAFALNFKTNTSLAAKQQYVVELSDPFGSFKMANVVGSIITDNESSSIQCQLPNTVVEGDAYRLRLANLTSGSISKNNGTDITIHTLDANVKEESLSICSYDSVLINNQYFKEDGIYFDTLESTLGCDTLVAIDLKKIELEANIIDEDNIFGVDVDDADGYVWVRCDHDYEETGGYEQQFQPFTSGDYAAIVYNDGCVDTTQCVTYVSTLIEKNNTQIIAYPNPSDGIVQFELNKMYNRLRVDVYNISNQLVENYEFSDKSQFKLNLSQYRGTYFVVLRNDGGIVQVFKLFLK
nr:T9SS type A sorting domain-containing protein [uncultured Carboxylicivirga sp.]